MRNGESRGYNKKKNVQKEIRLRLELVILLGKFAN